MHGNRSQIVEGGEEKSEEVGPEHTQTTYSQRLALRQRRLCDLYFSVSGGA